MIPVVYIGPNSPTRFILHRKRY